ncbi:histidine--tRNA ligase [bacterium]|nr:histidine--tRNA ligase [bacterium]
MGGTFLATNPYKGTRDFYPEDMRLRNWFFSKMRDVVEQYGYEEYGGPILESFDLYAAKSGQELVNEQIYHFEDKGNRRLAIRPEMTPTVARMVASRINELAFPLRWYSIANLMRYERPQKGRLREHWQLNVDVFGEEGIHADFEILSLIVDLMQAFGADGGMYNLRISNRRFFNDVMREVLKAAPEQIHVISKAVDKRSKISEEEYRNWLADSGISPEQVAQLDKVFASSFEELCACLPADSRGVAELQGLFSLLEETGFNSFCEFDFSVLRGFDYYTGTVFEVFDTSPENRRSLFGGGRYDDLIGLFSKQAVSGIGFGFGDVTFQDFLQIHNLIPADLAATGEVMIATFEDTPYREYARLSSELRSAGIANNIYLDVSAKMKKQLTYAERKGFPVVVFLGRQEIEDGAVVIKHMARREQETVSRGEYLEKLRGWLKS